MRQQQALEQVKGWHALLHGLGACDGTLEPPDSMITVARKVTLSWTARARMVEQVEAWVEEDEE